MYALNASDVHFSENLCILYLKTSIPGNCMSSVHFQMYENRDYVYINIFKDTWLPQKIFGVITVSCLSLLLSPINI